MRVLYGKFESDQALVTCHAHVDSETVYMYEIMIADKVSGYVSSLNPKRLIDGSFELIVELVKRGKHPKHVKRVFQYIDERNMVKRISRSIILKNKEAVKEQVKAYLSRKFQMVGNFDNTANFNSEEMEVVLEIIAGATLK